MCEVKETVVPGNKQTKKKITVKFTFPTMWRGKTSETFSGVALLKTLDQVRRIKVSPNSNVGNPGRVHLQGKDGEAFSIRSDLLHDKLHEQLRDSPSDSRRAATTATTAPATAPATATTTATTAPATAPASVHEALNVRPPMLRRRRASALVEAGPPEIQKIQFEPVACHTKPVPDA